MSSPTPFHINVEQSALDHIQQQVANYPWQAMPELNDWELGCNPKALRSLCDYWLHDFDWRRQEAELNQFAHFKAQVDYGQLHYIHEHGSGDNPTPLLIVHGWPGSVLEFKHIIDVLAHPERHGGKIEDAFDVVAPSLPGFGFSDKPSLPMGPRAMAVALDQLMTQSLGYSSYVAQGGDWGGAVCSWIGLEHPACRAIHINILTMRHPDGPQTPAEEQWAAGFDRDQEIQNGYRTQQATKPQSLGFAMMDSPVGIAAWILEKFHGWSDLRERELFDVHTMDDVLSNIMLYILTGTFNSASWIYAGRRAEGGRVLSNEGKRVEVPTAAAVFPREMLAWPPRSYVDRIYNIQHWSEFDHGGHFPAMEEPVALVNDLRAFVRKIGQ